MFDLPGRRVSDAQERAVVTIGVAGAEAAPSSSGLEVLEGALAIGRQADPLGPDEVRTSIERAKGRVAASLPPTVPVSPELKSWLVAMK